MIQKYKINILYIDVGIILKYSFLDNQSLFFYNHLMRLWT